MRTEKAIKQMDKTMDKFLFSLFTRTPEKNWKKYKK